MSAIDPPPSRPGRHRGLESVVRLYLSRPRLRPRPADQQPPPPPTPGIDPGGPGGLVGAEKTLRADDALQAAEDRVGKDALQAAESKLVDVVPSASVTSLGDENVAGHIPQSEGARGRLKTRPTIDTRHADAPDVHLDDAPPLDPADETPAPGEEWLPPLRLGDEAVRAEAAFQLEEDLLESKIDASSGEPGAPTEPDVRRSQPPPPGATLADPEAARETSPSDPLADDPFAKAGREASPSDALADDPFPEAGREASSSDPFVDYPFPEDAAADAPLKPETYKKTSARAPLDPMTGAASGDASLHQVSGEAALGDDFLDPATGEAAERAASLDLASGNTAPRDTSLHSMAGEGARPSASLEPMTGDAVSRQTSPSGDAAWNPTPHIDGGKHPLMPLIREQTAEREAGQEHPSASRATDDTLQEIELYFVEDLGETAGGPHLATRSETSDPLQMPAQGGAPHLLPGQKKGEPRALDPGSNRRGDLSTQILDEGPQEESREGTGAIKAPARVVLAVSTAPYHIRQRLIDALCSPVAAEGRRVMIVESDPRHDALGEIFEQSLGLDVCVFRRSLGTSTRELLLMPAAERRALLERIAIEETRAEMIVVDVELPESILCPRLQFLVDTIVVAITSRESSLYEAYRALRGLADRRPGLVPYVVPIARSEAEAHVLRERFRTIASDFLGMPIVDGGWIALPGTESVGGVHELDPGTLSGAPLTLVEPLTAVLRGDPSATPPRSKADFRVLDRPFFEQLADWFGPPLR